MLIEQKRLLNNINALAKAMQDYHDTWAKGLEECKELKRRILNDNTKVQQMQEGHNN